MTEYSQQILSVISTLETQLETLKNEQNALAEKIVNAKDSSVSKEELDQIKATMNKVSAYNTKLLSLKATMTMLTGRSKQLLNKAEKLKDIKKQYLLQIDDIRRKEQEKDQAIAAKPFASPTIPPEIPETPGSPASAPATPATPATPTTPESTPSTPIMAKAMPKVVSVKKKKKAKAREVTLGDESSPAWIPKKSLSQKDLLKK